MKPFYLDFSLSAHPSLSLYFPLCPRKFYIISLYYLEQFSSLQAPLINSIPGPVLKNANPVENLSLKITTKSYVVSEF